MAHYAKGANAERELIHLLYDRGFAVVRVAGSGKTSLPCPDIVALAPKVKLAFECKAWDKEHLNITTAQMDELYKRCADRKSTRLNSSHSQISYDVFCL